MKMHRIAHATALFLTTVLCFRAGATIEDYAFVDTRSTGMAGANSASVNDAAAGLVNPAVLGFMARDTESEADNQALAGQNFGWNVLDAGIGGTLTGDLGDVLEVLANADFDNFNVDNLKDPENIKHLLSLAGTLGSVSDRDTIVANASAGTAFQIGHFGVGVHAFGQVGGWINDLDVANLGLQLGLSEISDALDDAMLAEGFDPTGYTLQTFSAENIDALREAFDSNLLDDDALYYLDHKATELIQANDLDPDKIQELADTLVSMVENSGGAGGILADNETSITGRAFAAVEIPVSYGYAVNDNLSFGVTAKAMFGRVFGTQVWAFNEDNTGILEDSLNSSNDSATFGLDAAMMYRIPNFQFALVGHNLNSPTFDGYSQTVNLNGVDTVIRVPDVVLDPQVTIGAAWIPTRRVTLETDLELLETGTLLNYYDVQRISFGSELDLSLLALRLGTYRNLAEADTGWVLTAGIGAQLWALSLDIGGAISVEDTVNYDGVDYPRSARLNVAIGMDF